MLLSPFLPILMPVFGPFWVLYDFWSMLEVITPHCLINLSCYLLFNPIMNMGSVSGGVSIKASLSPTIDTHNTIPSLG